MAKARGNFEKNGRTLYFQQADAKAAAKAAAQANKHILGRFKAAANQPGGFVASCTVCGEEAWLQYGRMGEYWEVLSGNCQVACSGGKA